MATIDGNASISSVTLANSVTGSTITYKVKSTEVFAAIANKILVVDLLKNGSLRKNNASTINDKYISRAFLIFKYLKIKMLSCRCIFVFKKIIKF